MSPGVQITLSFAVTWGVPALLGLRELILLRRERGRDPGWPPSWHDDPPYDIPPPPSAPAARPAAPAPGQRALVLEEL